MQLLGILIFLVSLYIAYNVGKIVGRTQAFLKGANEAVKKKNTSNIEEADYEEIN